MANTLTFSTQQQAALIGHALLNHDLWDQLDAIGADKEWVIDPAIREVWNHISGFRVKYGRAPSPQELDDYIESTEPDHRSANSKKKSVLECLKAANEQGVDIILQGLSEWSKSRAIVVKLHQVQDIYNNHQNVAKSCEVILGLANEIERINTLGGYNPDRLESTASRAIKEYAARQSNRGKYLESGLTFYDEMTGGISKNDLILLGAKTGAGKTEAITIIAEHNAIQGKRVAAFMLEAHEHELEARLKYRMISRRFRESDSAYRQGIINYPDWYLGKLDHLLGKYEPDVTKSIHKDYRTLKTYYRSRSDFGMEEFEREIYKVNGKVDLAILDHVHYMDLDGDNENREIKELMKRMRTITQSIGVPIIAVVHLRKSSGGVKKLMPDREDIHGSSDLSKIATSILLLGRAYGVVTTDQRTQGYPTFMRIDKHRLAGPRTSKVGLSFFDSEINSYKPNYVLGTMNHQDTKWVQEQNIPPWAKSAIDVEVLDAE